MADVFDLRAFEQMVYRRDLEAAARQLGAVLNGLDRHLGALAPWLTDGGAPLAEAQAVARLGAALTGLLSEPGLAFAPAGFFALIRHYRWLAALFAAGGLGHADHVLRTLPDAATPRDLARRMLLHLPDSALDLPLDQWWAVDPAMTAAFCLGLLAARFTGTPAAHAKREAVLRWLPDRLVRFGRIEPLPLYILHDAYMHCSYADQPERHAVKRAINRLMRGELAAAGLTDLESPSAPPRDGRPTMLVMVEYFSSRHSIFRTHSQTLRAARDHFHLVGVGAAPAVDEAGRAVFHRFVAFPSDLPPLAVAGLVRRLAEELRPAVLYLPSIGMSLPTIALANLRLAPLQIAGLGHPATTLSDRIDAVSVEADFVGDPACFSEALLTLPPDGQPYVPPAAMPAAPAVLPPARPVVEIAVAAAAMKINPRFLAACRELAAASPLPVRFHFLPAFGVGVVHRQMAGALGAALGDRAICHGQLPFAAYAARLAGCDLFLSPFPFGNTNSIVDAFTLGLPGVCLRGPEVFERIDGALFARAGLPDWLVADTPAAYVRAALRLVAEGGERLALRRLLLDEARVTRLFAGDPQAFPRAVLAMLRARPAGGRD